ncbi:hypothetical protein T492DRAFT_870003, partial [Pavlovales sp. CCMP2436]
MEGFLTKEPSHPYGRQVRRYFVLDAGRGVLSCYRDASGAVKHLSLRHCMLLADSLGRGLRLRKRDMPGAEAVVLLADSREEDQRWRQALAAAIAGCAASAGLSGGWAGGLAEEGGAAEEMGATDRARGLGRPRADTERAGTELRRARVGGGGRSVDWSKLRGRRELRRMSESIGIGATLAALAAQTPAPSSIGAISAVPSTLRAAAAVRSSASGANAQLWKFGAEADADETTEAGFAKSAGDAIGCDVAGASTQQLYATAEDAAEDAAEEAPSRLRMMLLLFTACVHISTSAGLVFGWPALEPLLLQEGFGQQLCAATAAAASVASKESNGALAQTDANASMSSDLLSFAVGASSAPSANTLRSAEAPLLTASEAKGGFGGERAAPAPKGEEPVSGECAASRLRLSLMFTLGALGSNLSNCVFGAVLDRCNLLASLTLLAGALLMAVALGQMQATSLDRQSLARSSRHADYALRLQEGPPHSTLKGPHERHEEGEQYGGQGEGGGGGWDFPALCVGFFLLGFGGPGVQMPAYQLAALVPSLTVPLLSLFAALFNLSECGFAAFAA